MTLLDDTNYSKLSSRDVIQTVLLTQCQLQTNAPWAVLNNTNKSIELRINTPSINQW